MEVCLEDGHTRSGCQCVTRDAAVDATMADASLPDGGSGGDGGPVADGGSGTGDGGMGDAGVSSGCPNACPLYPSSYPPDCSGSRDVCRISGCTTYCSGVVDASQLIEHGQPCDLSPSDPDRCARGQQCLEVFGGGAACRRFCRLSEGAADCADLGASYTCAPTTGITTRDGAAVMLTSGIGLCARP